LPRAGREKRTRLRSTSSPYLCQGVLGYYMTRQDAGLYAGPAACAPADRAAAGPKPWPVLHLPDEIWQRITRAVLAAEGGDLCVWAG